ncbi:MAG TPA: hypothetical protein VG604_02985 [Candidatus Saccharimonadales bacterium]|nr:hypothetical protein [Candidatus Saccharimonadales bacterium]
MKRLWLGAGLAVIVVVACFGIYQLANGFLSNDEHQAATACSQIGQNHKVLVVNNKVVPKHTTAKRCDRLVITNEDAVSRLMSFGKPDHHVSYNGVTERLLTQGQSLSVVLTKTGNYYFHDHLQDYVVNGSFTVTN